MDGKFTLNENVCDIDGLNVASKAFSDLREASANDLVHLPNNPYTPQQLFFINTAQVIFLCILTVSKSKFKQTVITQKRLPQHESLHPIGLKSARIEIPNIGLHYIEFSKTFFYY